MLSCTQWSFRNPIIIDGYDYDQNEWPWPPGNPGMDRGHGGRHWARRFRTSPVSITKIGWPSRNFRRRCPLHGLHPVPQHHSSRTRGPIIRESGIRIQNPLYHPLERGNDGDACQPWFIRTRGPYCQFCFFCTALWHRFQPLLECPRTRTWWRPGLHPGTFGSRDLCQGFSRGTDHRRTDESLPPGIHRKRSFILSPPLADAGILAVSHGLDGFGSDHGNLPGPLSKIPSQPWIVGYWTKESLVLSWGWRNRWAWIDGGHSSRSSWKTGQSYFCHQLQPPATGRPSPRKRQNHTGTGRRVQGCRLECDQSPVGFLLGSASGQRRSRAVAEENGRSHRRRISGLQSQGRCLYAHSLFWQVSGTAGNGLKYEWWGYLETESRRPWST